MTNLCRRPGSDSFFHRGPAKRIVEYFGCTLHFLELHAGCSWKMRASLTVGSSKLAKFAFSVTGTGHHNPLGGVLVHHFSAFKSWMNGRLISSPSMFQNSRRVCNEQHYWSRRSGEGRKSISLPMQPTILCGCVMIDYLTKKYSSNTSRISSKPL